MAMDRSKWEYKKLGEVCTIERGGSPRPIADYLTDDPQGINWIKIGDAVEGSKYISQTKEKIKPEGMKKSRFVHKGDFILSNSMSFGRPYILQVDGCIHDGWLVLHDNDDIFNKDFLYYYLSSPSTYNTFKKLAVGGVVNNLNSQLVRGVNVSIPPITDQQRIVAELDCLNEMIAVKQQQLKEFDKLAQSIFYDMFGDPMVNDKNWNMSSYGKEFEIGSGGTPSKSISDYWENGNIPWIGSNMCQNCFIYDNDGKFITQNGLKNSSAKVLKAGTILFALVGATIGKVGILKKEMATNQNIAFVNVWKSDVFDSIFVFFHSMKLYSLFMNLGNGGFKMANQSFIKDLPIICPPLSLQQQFAEKISAIEAQKELVKQSIAETQALLDYTMDKYFG